MPRLRKCFPSDRGLARAGRDGRFLYEDERGRIVADPATLDRIAGLAIPPAWRDVWICPWPNGHIQAVGTDAAGRRQYLYHAAWRERRDERKFDRMLVFARSLPELRRITSEHLSQEGLTRQRVLACAVRLLDRGFFRVGGEAYAEEHNTYGLATMRRAHARLGGHDQIVFDYVAKGHKERVQAIVDRDVYDVVAALKTRDADGGDELLAYRNGDGVWRDVRSQDINEYLKAVAGGDYSAKDFRTWHATVLAALGLAVSTLARRSHAASRRAVTRTVTEVAHYLGNTPAVARSSYIDPRVIDRYLAGRTIAPVLDHLVIGDPLADPDVRAIVERAVIALIQNRSLKRAVGEPAAA
ncbi:MAG TPA: DNA topoisomerase IB [Candidatus Dormibacteraeota bacterium]|nr:DNA topoisomerase IB [Candidatus Dormibacteraeota bacterium]